MSEAVPQATEAAAEVTTVPAPPEAASVSAARFDPIPATGRPLSGEARSLEMLMDVNLRVAVELGRTHLSVREILELQAGSVIELDRLAGELVDVVVNDRLMARGEVVVVDDNFGVRITELAGAARTAGAA